MSKKRNISEILKKFCFRYNLENFVVIKKSSYEMYLYNSKDDTIISAEFNPYDNRASVRTETLNVDAAIKLYPYRKNSRKFIVPKKNRDVYTTAFKYKIKKLGIKSVNIKEKTVRVESKNIYHQRYKLKETVRVFILDIKDKSDYGIFCLHFGHLIQDKKYRV